MNRLSVIISVTLLWLLASCKAGTPKHLIQPGDMEDILVDYHLAMALAEESGQRAYDQNYYMASVLSQHGVTQADFDSSMVYYYTHSDRFITMYRRVSERLEERALSLGATEGEIGKYAVLKADGDTANIWPDKRMAILKPMPPYNRLDFTIEGDTTFRRGDTFLMQFMSDFFFQDGNKNAVCYVAVQYPDTVLVGHQRFYYSGLNRLRVPSSDTATVQRISGFLLLGGAGEQTTTQRMLFLNNIQFIRFHKQHEPEKPAADSVASIDEARRPTADTVGGRDTVRGSFKVLSPGGRVGTNRMVLRHDTAELRR